MKGTVWCVLLSGMLVTMLPAAEKVIKLPEPDRNGGKPLMQVLTERKSSRNMTDKALTPDELSGLFYAATGVTRDDGRRTNPTAANVQDVVLFAAMKEGLYRYNPAKHQLELEQDRDFREFTGRQKQMHTTAPVVLILTSDLNKMKQKNWSDELIAKWAPLHAGCVAQNIYLYATSQGLLTVICGAVDYKKLAEEMKLPENWAIWCTQPVGKR